ncbi:MAG: BREX-1 system phosphatase PglZ type B [Clostridia bacterium]|nr:BREX-1 system phosphatase PglZ type B [Clostridia bacterium]
MDRIANDLAKLGITNSHCVLWPDQERQWEKAIPALSKEIPGLLCLGDYKPEAKTGPAIWLRCAIAGKIKDNTGADEMLYVLYLPGISKHDLRAVESCPEEIKALVELQFSGTIWSQYNGKDWTLLAWLISDKGGLGLEVSQDLQTKQALHNALLPLLEENIEDLRGKRLDQDFFNSLLSGGDPIRDMLTWLDQGNCFQEKLSPEQWQAFCGYCQSRFAINPEQDGLISAVKHLVESNGATALAKNWQQVWHRYCDSPHKYSKIPNLIRKLPIPDDWLYLQNEDHSYDRYPQWNDEMERILGQALESLAKTNVKDAEAKIAALEDDHARRRLLLWAELGEAKCAMMLQDLAEVARLTARPMEQGNLAELEKRYAEHFWLVDRAVVRVLQKVDSGADLGLITSILDLFYKPWIEASARHLQNSGMETNADKTQPAGWLDRVEAVLFVDGLRFDCAKELSEMLCAEAYQTEESIRWTGLPTITATCKPILIQEMAGAEDNRQGGDALNYEAMTSYEFKKTLEQNNWRLVSNNEIIPHAIRENGKPAFRLWLEYGNLDELGHSQGWGLAKHIDGTLAELAGRVKELFRAGWESVMIITDHGWLLYPGGLPKAELPACLSESKWQRFATLKDGADTKEHIYPWYWNPQQQIALADGVSCYRKGVEFTHGGLSVQECLLLDLKVSKGSRPQNAISVKITDIKWTNMRCSIAIDDAGAGLSFDLRTSPGDPLSSVALSVKPIKSNHTASVVVEDVNLEGQKAYIVIFDTEQNIVSQIQTTIGGGSDDSTG